MRRSIIRSDGSGGCGAVAMCGGSDTPTGPSNTGPLVFTATLSGANENPPITGAEANGRGNATVTINVPRDGSGNPTGGGTANFSAQLSGLPAGTPIILGHIHVGRDWRQWRDGREYGPDGRGAFRADGAGTGNLVFNDRPVDAGVAQRIYANPAGFYVNFHSQNNGGGVVRGQMVRVQ